MRAATPFGKANDTHDLYRTVERQRDNVVGAQDMAWRDDAGAVDADMTGFNQGRRRVAGTDHARMPKPFVDALAVYRCGQGDLLALFGAVFELLLEGSELGEGRIWIRFLVVADLEAGLGVIRLAIGTIDRRATIATSRTIVTLVTLVAFLLPLLTLLPVVAALIPLFAVGVLLAAIAALGTRVGLLLGSGVGCRLCGLIGRWRSLRALRILIAARLTRTARMLRLAIGTSGWTPDFDHFRFG